jgi:hypothetical protein
MIAFGLTASKSGLLTTILATGTQSRVRAFDALQQSNVIGRRAIKQDQFEQIKFGDKPSLRLPLKAASFG